MLRRGTHHDEALEDHARQHRALSPRGEPVRSPAPASFFVLFHGCVRWEDGMPHAGNRGRGGMTGSVTGIRRRRGVAGRRETPHLPLDRDFYGQTLSIVCDDTLRILNQPRRLRLLSLVPSITASSSPGSFLSSQLTSSGGYIILTTLVS